MIDINEIKFERLPMHEKIIFSFLCETVDDKKVYHIHDNVLHKDAFVVMDEFIVFKVFNDRILVNYEYLNTCGYLDGNDIIKNKVIYPRLNDVTYCVLVMDLNLNTRVLTEILCKEDYQYSVNPNTSFFDILALQNKL